MAELYPSIIPVKPDVDMVVTPAQLDVSAGDDVVTVVQDTVFAFPVIALDESLAQAPVLQLSLEYSLAPAGGSMSYSVYCSPDSNFSNATQSSRDIVMAAVPNWLSGTVYFTLFKDVDWDSSVGELHLGIQGATATPSAPVFGGANMGFSYTISSVP